LWYNSSGGLKVPEIETKVSKLEEVLQDFIVNVERAHLRTEAKLEKLHTEIEEFKESTLRFQAESEKDRRELRESLERYKAEAEKDRKEMQESFERYKAEAEKDRKEMREEIKGLNKKWGELANKMGTITEDLIAPALRPVLDKYFRCNPIMEGQRIRRRINGEHYEVDAIAVCDDKVFMIEERSTPKFHHVEEIKKKSERFFKFFPEHKDKELIVIFGSITFPPDVIQEASKKGIYVMGWREWEYMDILNFEEVKRESTE
jgi:hypothetical protein